MESIRRRPALFTPFKLGGLDLPNRIAVSPMCQYAAVDGTAQPWHWMHVGGFAISGAGLVLLEATAVEAVGRISHHCLGLYSDENERALTRLVRDMKSFAPSPMKIGVQLAHAGRKASNYDRCSPKRDLPLTREDGAWEVVGPSALPYDTSNGWQTPRALDEPGLAHVKQRFVDAAQRAARCGFDLVEFHGAHGYLLHTFVSPLTNVRTDRYFCLTYIGVVVAQMFAAEDGAGYELIKAISLHQNGKMFAIVAVIMAIALVINFAFLLLEQRARVHRPDYAARFAAEA